jgi:putative autoinducer-2 (AI-2) aldolase
MPDFDIGDEPAGPRVAVNTAEDFVASDIKGSEHYEWGMKARLASLFSRGSGNVVMAAFDHGYMLGPIPGMERVDHAVAPLLDHVDVLMATRGVLRTWVRPDTGKAIVLRCSAGSTVLSEDVSRETITTDIDDALRLNVACVAVQVYLGSDNETASLANLSRAINDGMRYGMPVLGVVAVGREMERTSRFFRLATRVIAEMGAQVIKTYYCEDFDSVVGSCPVPLVVAGGKKVPEREALQLVADAMGCGAHGVDMGRNIFQAEHPGQMARAISAIVHDGVSATDAYELYTAGS